MIHRPRRTQNRRPRGQRVVTRRFDLTDAQWAILGPLPVPRLPGRPSKWTRRQLIDGIRWRVRTGAPPARIRPDRSLGR
ncbi:transposase [Spirillospora sp. NPDC046719]